MADPQSGASFAAVILAAGRGTRIRSERPKVLHEICGRPMLWHVLEAARSAGAGPLFVVVGPGRDPVREAMAGGCDDVEWVVQESRLGTGHALLAARGALGGEPRTLVVLNGDLPLVRPETIRRVVGAHRGAGARMTLLAATLADATDYGRVIRDAQGRIVSIVEEGDASPEERAVREVNTGVYAFDSPGIFEVLGGLAPNERKGEVFVTDVVAAIAGAGDRVGSVVVEDPSEVLGVNGRRDLARAAAAMRARILDRLMSEGVTVVDPRSTYVDVDVEIGRDTVLHPCTVIRAGVRIGRGCEIGPFTHLRTGTRMEDRAEVGNFTEVKKTRIGEGSKAKHLTYLGDAIVGRGANVGAGTITANFDGVRKSVSRIGDGAFIGSGTVIVAPAEIGPRGTTGAGAVVTKGSRVGPGEVYVGVPARKLEKRGGKAGG